VDEDIHYFRVFFVACCNVRCTHNPTFSVSIYHTQTSLTLTILIPPTAQQYNSTAVT